MDPWVSMHHGPLGVHAPWTLGCPCSMDPQLRSPALSCINLPLSSTVYNNSLLGSSEENYLPNFLKSDVTDDAIVA